MRHLYLVPVDLLKGREIGAHEALTCPSAPDWRLLVVHEWVSGRAQDAFEAYPGVLELSPWDADKLAPDVLVAAFQNAVASVSALDTLRTALWKIRAFWPVARY